MPQDRQRLFAQLRIVLCRFQLHNRGAFAVQHVHHIGEQRDAQLFAVRAEQRHRLQLLERIAVNAPGKLRFAIHLVVMEYHDLAVLAQLHIQLHAVAVLHGKLKGAQRVFRHGLIRGKQPAVCAHQVAKRRGLLL